MRPTRALPIALLSLAACKQEPPRAATADTTAPAAPAAAVAAAPITAQCLPVSKEMLASMRIGVKGAGSNKPIADLNHMFAIRDPNGPLYYISGTAVSQEGGAPYVMTWASQGVEPGQGIIFAVTPGARSITQFPDSLPGLAPNNASGAAAASRQCVMKATGVTKGL